MGRSGSVVVAVKTCLLFFVFGFLVICLAGCGNKSGVTTTVFAVPSTITINPASNLSIELGTYQLFTASVMNSSGQIISEPVSFQSSNTAVLTVAANGTACAGSWDSLANPQICTPGQTGTADVVATAQGVSSPTTTVYVHQHVDKVVVSRFLLPNEPPPTAPCSSVGQVAHYKATAYSRNVDITSTVGIFTWQALNLSVATLDVALHNGNGMLAGQVTLTANVPGVTPVFATIGNTNSPPVNFTTCAVDSIQLAVNGDTSNTIMVSGTSATATATVKDILGTTINNVPLTWTSSQPASVSVSSSGVLSGSQAGSAAVIASCTPPTCNIGFPPPLLPIYPENVVNMFVGKTGSSNSTLYVSSTGCGTVDGCVSTLVPVTAPSHTVGTAITLPATPNSLVFSRQGDKAYLGTNSGLLGTKGLMVFSSASSSSVPQFPAAPGKVLAVSPDGSQVIVSDTTDTPNQVYVFNTTTGTITALSIAGATAADFSPDSLRAFVVAGTNLYVYSTLESLKKIALGSVAYDVSFLSEGAFAYLAGGSPSAVTVRRTCGDNGLADIVPTPATPRIIKTLPDAQRVLAVDPPGVDLIRVSASPTGCAPSVSDSVTSYDLGKGGFTAKQLIIAPDGATAYIVSPNLTSIVVFNASAVTSSAIALAGSATPVQAALTPDGSVLYVAASDGTVHILDTTVNADIEQISFPQNLCLNSSGQPESFTCAPDLIGVVP